MYGAEDDAECDEENLFGPIVHDGEEEHEDDDQYDDDDFHEDDERAYRSFRDALADDEEAAAALNSREREIEAEL